MDNLQLGQIWQQIADLLEILGENTYKVAAYRRGARSIIKSPVPLAELIANEELGSLPGIGKSLESSALEFFRTGKLELLAELERQVPEDLLLLTRLGVSPKLAGRLHRELGIENLPDLEAALKERKVRKLRVVPRRAAAEAHCGAAKKDCPIRGRLRSFSIRAAGAPVGSAPDSEGGNCRQPQKGRGRGQTANLVLGTTLSKEELTSFLSGLPLVSEAKEEPLGVVLRGGLVVELSCVLRSFLQGPLAGDRAPEASRAAGCSGSFLNFRQGRGYTGQQEFPTFRPCSAGEKTKSASPAPESFQSL